MSRNRFVSLFFLASLLAVSCKDEMPEGFVPTVGNLAVEPADSSGQYNGHAFVDLGLSVNWATCNVGAANHLQPGDYFAWGELQPKQCYDWDTYRWMTPGYHTSYGCSKYQVPDREFKGVWYDGFTFIGDNQITLQPSDDAATVNWGGHWRLPTQSELAELRKSCHWTWDADSKGYRVVGPSGLVLFLPAAGTYSDAELRDFPESCFYPSSMIDNRSTMYIHGVYFNATDCDLTRRSRFFGHVVRAVFDK